MVNAFRRCSFAALFSLVGSFAGWCSAEDCDPGERIFDLTSYASGGYLVCGRSPVNSDRWQEEHLAGGTLYERARGENDPVDPGHVVGTWAVVNNDRFDFQYGTEPSFPAGFYQDPDDGQFYFCIGGQRRADVVIINPIPDRSNTSACRPFLDG